MVIKKTQAKVPAKAKKQHQERTPIIGGEEHLVRDLCSPARRVAAAETDVAAGNYLLYNVGQSKVLEALGTQQQVRLRSAGGDTGKKAQHHWTLSAGPNSSYYIVNAGTSQFLDTHGNAVWMWGDGKDVGQVPGATRLPRCISQSCFTHT